MVDFLRCSTTSSHLNLQQSALRKVSLASKQKFVCQKKAVFIFSNQILLGSRIPEHMELYEIKKEFFFFNILIRQLDTPPLHFMKTHLPSWWNRCGMWGSLRPSEMDRSRPRTTLGKNHPEKGSTPRTLPISAKLAAMLNAIPKTTPTVFGVTSDVLRQNFQHQRKRITFKLQNPRLNQITVFTFRHWKATMEYRKTRDMLHVKEVLGHKSLNNTMLYTQLISFKDDEFNAKARIPKKKPANS